MKKERRPLTKREKVLIGVGVVGIGVAGYFGYKYWENSKNYRALKTINEDLLRELMSKDTEAEIAKKIALEAMDAANDQEVINDITKEELSFLKFLIVEGNILPHATQNGKNKLERVKNKILRLEKHITDRGAQLESVKELEMLKNDESFLINCLEKAGMIQQMVDNDSLDYAK